MKLILSSLLVLCIVAAVRGEDFDFRDVAKEAGLAEHLAGIQGHAAGWGDIDGDGWLDLYVGTFYEAGGKTNRLFRNKKGGFSLDPQESVRIKARSNSGLFADFDNRGVLDLYVSSMPQPKNELNGNTLFKNDGTGLFTNIAKDNGACPTVFGGRSACLVDFDGDGLVDLFVGEEPLVGYSGSPTKRCRLFKNLGDHRFEDVTDKVGLPADMPGLGVAAGDFNGDGWPDLFAAAARGGNRLFINDGKGKFTESLINKEVFDWYAKTPKVRGDDTPCGICVGDINRDGKLDIFIGHHFQRPWIEPVPNRLYLNRGVKDGQVVFEEITEQAGLTPLFMKAPHVEIQDFDNDGWPDLYGSMVVFKDGRPHPLIWKNLGVKDGMPRFETKTLGLTDFPRPEERKMTKTAVLFDELIRDKRLIYMAAGPSADFDRDGKIDLFLPNWWTTAPSLLLKNETPGGNWLDVEVIGGKGVNRQGIGSVVRLYPAGKLGDAKALLGHREIASGYGYTSAQEAIAHFGLGSTPRVDVEILLPHGKGRLEQRDVAANARVKVTAQ